MKSLFRIGLIVIASLGIGGCHYYGPYAVKRYHYSYHGHGHGHYGGHFRYHHGHGGHHHRRHYYRRHH